MKPLVLALLLLGLLGSRADAGIYGALAIGKCDQYGYSWNQTTYVAQKAALKACGNDCRIAATISTACAAFAISPDCAAQGWAWANAPVAEYLAKEQCSNNGGANCQVVRSVCSGL
jgi:hypothetical protein